MDKGEGKGIGWGMELLPGTGPTRASGQRGKWNTEPAARREEDVFARVIGTDQSERKLAGNL